MRSKCWPPHAKISYAEVLTMYTESDITDNEATRKIHLLWQGLNEFVLFPLLYIVPSLMLPSFFPGRYQYLLRDASLMALSWTGLSGVVYYLLSRSISHLWHNSQVFVSV